MEPSNYSNIQVGGQTLTLNEQLFPAVRGLITGAQGEKVAAALDAKVNTLVGQLKKQSEEIELLGKNVTAGERSIKKITKELEVERNKLKKRPSNSVQEKVRKLETQLKKTESYYEASRTELAQRKQDWDKIHKNLGHMREALFLAGQQSWAVKHKFTSVRAIDKAFKEIDGSFAKNDLEQLKILKRGIEDLKGFTIFGFTFGTPRPLTDEQKKDLTATLVFAQRLESKGNPEIVKAAQTLQRSINKQYGPEVREMRFAVTQGVPVKVGSNLWQRVSDGLDEKKNQFLAPNSTASKRDLALLEFDLSCVAQFSQDASLATKARQSMQEVQKRSQEKFGV